MKKFKFLAIIAMVSIFAMAFLCSCNHGSAPAKEYSLTDGVYVASFSPGAGNPDQNLYLRFHENGEVIEGVSTFYLFINQTGQTSGDTAMLGTYEITNTSFEYSVYASRDVKTSGDNAVLTTGTASQTLTLKSLDGTTTYFTTGYQDGVIYGIAAENGNIAPAPFTQYMINQVIDERVDTGVK